MAAADAGAGARAVDLKPRPYLWVCALAALLLVPVCLRLPWGGDLGVHAATLERLSADLAHPGNPMVAADTGSPYYSPWTVLLGFVAQISGLSAFTVLKLGALFSLTVLGTGVWRFARALTPARWAPVLLLLCMVLLWGTQLFVWSGFLPLSSLALTVAYPSTLAWGLTLHLWAWLPGSAQLGWPLPRALGLGLFAAVVLLVHQFTGAVLLLGVAAFAVAGWRTTGPRGLLRLAAGVLLGAAVLVAWPYYDFFRLSNAPGEDAIHHALYQHPLVRYGLAVLGLPALWARFRRRRLDPLVLLFALCAVVLLAGGVSGHWALGRVLPGAMFALQAALAVELATGWQGRVWLRRVVGPLTGLALLAGAWAQATTLSYAVAGDASLAHRLDMQTVDVQNGYAWITPYVQPGEVVMSDDYFATRRVPAYGGYVVFCPYPDPFLRDWSQRDRAMATFFRPSTAPSTRASLLARYHAQWIIEAPNDRVSLDAWYQRVATAPGNGAVLYRVGPGL